MFTVGGRISRNGIFFPCCNEVGRDFLSPFVVFVFNIPLSILLILSAIFSLNVFPAILLPFCCCFFMTDISFANCLEYCSCQANLNAASFWIFSTQKFCCWVSIVIGMIASSLYNSQTCDLFKVILHFRSKIRRRIFPWRHCVSLATDTQNIFEFVMIMAGHEIEKNPTIMEEELMTSEEEKKTQRTSELYRTKNLPERFDRPGVHCTREICIRILILIITLICRVDPRVQYKIRTSNVQNYRIIIWVSVS